MKSRNRLDQKKKRRRKLRRYFADKVAKYEYQMQQAFERYIIDLKSLKRKHANYFESPCKKIKELVIAQSFYQILEQESDEYLVSIKHAEDPPDIKIITNKERCVGVEITELVSEKAIEYQIKEQRGKYLDDILSWNRERFVSEIQKIINNKSEKCKNIAQGYDELVLLIFTDEPILRADRIDKYLIDVRFEHADGFDSIYLLKSYDPNRRGKVLFKIGT